MLFVGGYDSVQLLDVVVVDVVLGAGSGHQARAATEREGRTAWSGKLIAAMGPLSPPPPLSRLEAGDREGRKAAAELEVVGSIFTLIGGDSPATGDESTEVGDW